MQAARLFSLVVAAILLTTLSGMSGPSTMLRAGAAPLTGPCAAGAAYDPACDVDHDGDVDIFDLQLTASHWNQYGAYVSDNNHDHLGQTWTGTDNPLKIEGSFAVNPNHFAFQGKNTAANSIGVRGEANASGSVGVWGQSNANTGVYGLSTDGAGVWGQSTTGFGIRAESTYNVGVWVPSASTGLYVLSSSLDGMAVGSAGSDGLHVYSAYFNGVYANTTQPSGQWGFYTPDRIFGTVGMFSAVSLVAQVSGSDSLTAGDLVAVAGVADPLPGSTARTPLVRLADGTSPGVIGVVEHRLALTSQPSRPAAEGGEASTEPTLELRNADGPAQAGDYVAIIVLGAAQVKVAPGERAIAVGTRLTAAADGAVRPLGTIQVQLADGKGAADLAESAPVVGVALEPARDGLVWVFVKPQ